MAIAMFMLMEQKDSITRSIASEEVSIMNIESTIERLEEAVQLIESNEQAMETSKVQISNLVIDPSLWRGSEQKTYKERASTYEEDVKKLLTRIEDIHTEIETELQKQKEYLQSTQNRILDLETSLSLINKEIEQQSSLNNG